MRDLYGGACGCHEVLKRTGGAESADAESAALKAVAADGGGMVEMIEVGDPGGWDTVSVGQPVHQSLIVGGDPEVPGGALEVDAFADKSHRARVGLEKTEI